MELKGLRGLGCRSSGTCGLGFEDMNHGQDATGILCTPPTKALCRTPEILRRPPPPGLEAHRSQKGFRGYSLKRTNAAQAWNPEYHLLAQSSHHEDPQSLCVNSLPTRMLEKNPISPIYFKASSTCTEASEKIPTRPGLVHQVLHSIGEERARRRRPSGSEAPES